MLLYHGSNLPIENPLLLPASHPTDFGTGFYTTTNHKQAADFANRVVKLRNGVALVNIYEFNENEMEKYLILRFESPNADWLHFVVNNRMSKQIEKNYDLIIGPVANDDVYETIIAFENGIYDEQETLKRLLVRNLYNQYVFKNRDIMSKLIFKEVKNV
ncbi:MAG: DUF3990 domain-containing protein [Candidatus Fibromonas sp.]|jgi:hypothetical protein|nr:DUF3990 domain-containing protein [Candidatus Fibromonas sp.]